jgi:flagellar motor switch protein FliN/FliY
MNERNAGTNSSHEDVAPAGPPDAAVSAGTQPAPPAQAAAANDAGPGDPKLEVLMGVHLDVALRFGEQQITLREILELSPGTVVELDRQANEPADLLVGGKVIARGEVVIVDGNYGIRVTELVGLRQRLDSLAR